MASSGLAPAVIGQALVDFAVQGIFPDEPLSTRRIGAQDFGPALNALAAAKAKLQLEIHGINQDTAADIQSWVANAKSLESDIHRSRTLANEIVRRAEAPEVSGATIREVGDKVKFLKREAHYNRQVHAALSRIKHANELLDQIERTRGEGKVLESLHLLEKASAAINQISVSRSCRVMRILDMRASELQSAVHDAFDRVWNTLVRVDLGSGQVTICENLQNEPMTLPEAILGLQAYKEVDQRMALLWISLDEAIIGPRTNLESSPLPGISISDSTLCLSGQADRSISSLFTHLEQIMGFLAKRLPNELVKSLCVVMMPDLIPRLKSAWLGSIVPASLKEIDEFQRVLEAVRAFCHSLRSMNYTGFDELQDWVDNAPKVWLIKCRETALDTVRTKLAQGLGSHKEVERVESQTVSRSEGAELAANRPPRATDVDDWGAAWGDGEGDNDPVIASQPAVADAPSTSKEEDGADAWGWGEDAEVDGQPEESTTAPASEPAAEDDGGDAWGWGDEDASERPAQEPIASQTISNQTTRELTMRETYKISSMPEPVLALISAILEDGAYLVGSDGNPVAAAAAGLFGLPTFVLAMFRAVSPYYYTLDISGGGNMYLYNDATYLAERLADLAGSWKTRDDLPTRAIAMLRLDNDIKVLKSFAARAYASEMSTQRTIVRDLLGGLQSMLQHGYDVLELTAQVEAATGRVRAVASIWSEILSKSAWCQAVGSLVDTLASKMITDVMDLPGIGQDEAFNIANLIAKIAELDDLFLPPGASKEDVPATSQYAENWLRMKFLSEFLQSNLNEVKYLWIESNLSLYFTVDEVVELIGLSFTDNARTRDVIREVKGNPQPRT